MVASKIANLSKPKLGQKPLPPAEVAAQSERMRAEVETRHAAELTALEEELAAMKVAEAEKPPVVEGSAVAVTAAEGSAAGAPASPAEAAAPSPAAGATSVPAVAASTQVAAAAGGAGASAVASAQQGGDDGKKKSRAERRKEKKAAEREALFEEAESSAATAASLKKQAEIELIEKQLKAMNLTIKHVDADGHCLFRAVADQLEVQTVKMAERMAASYGSKGSSSGKGAKEISSTPDFRTLRTQAAQHIRLRPSQYAAFLPYEPSDGYPEGDSPSQAEISKAVGNYCKRLESTGMWGGHAELQALADSLGWKLRIFQADAPPLVIQPYREEEFQGERAAASSAAAVADGWEAPELLLSYHRYYYALGEHYNSVVKP